MEKIKSKIDKHMVKELFGYFYILIILGFIAAVALIGCYVAFSILKKNWFDIINIVALSLAVLLIVFSSFLLIRIQKLINENAKFDRSSVIEMLDECFTYEVYRNDEKIEEGKCYYHDLLGYKETKNYVFLVMRNNSYLGVNKVDGLISFLDSKNLRRIKKIG